MLHIAQEPFLCVQKPFIYDAVNGYLAVESADRMAIYEERWGLWLAFECSNKVSHPPDSQIGVTVLTNSFYAPLVMARMSEKVCSVCGAPFVYVGQESALTPNLSYDFERMRSAGYNAMKDEEVIWAY